MSKEVKGNRIIISEDDDLGSYFRETFEWMWERGCTAKEIFEELQFNDPENPWGELKLYHVYYFARKWGLQKRNEKHPRIC